MSIFVLDACAMVAYIASESGALIVEGLLIDPKSICYAYSINLREVYYDGLRNNNEHAVRQLISDLSNAGVVTCRVLI